jgi:hypothetical protein
MPNRYQCSDGTFVTQSQIDRRYKQAREEKYAGVFGTLPCEACGQPSHDNDHTIAQRRCKDIHKAELIWHPDNFPRSCRICHRQWESYQSGDWLEHRNAAERLAFLKEHDHEGYLIRVNITELSLQRQIKKESNEVL